jgi:hypothetical protein
VAEGEWRVEAEIFLHHVQVRMADARAADLYQDLAGAGRRLSYVGYLSRMADANKPYCFHDYPPDVFRDRLDL